MNVKTDWAYLKSAARADTKSFFADGKALLCGKGWRLFLAKLASLGFAAFFLVVAVDDVKAGLATWKRYAWTAAAFYGFIFPSLYVLIIERRRELKPPSK